ncbi:MAG: DEAD/DEAH box helicase [Spirochaetales bacterium]|nr:DEAD/DEAH box helicase [Spirochaetales bacterium]
MEFFHPVIRSWFTRTLGQPTEAQAQAWPLITGGSHVLVSAPTGSGKTLTAFLWALQQLITGKLSLGAVRVLYISPLKALNSDMKKNLIKPLSELKKAFNRAGVPFPHVSVAVRSGDTPPEERRSFLRNPPEIFITTPESLNILLTTKKGAEVFSGLAVVILDEIHALVGSKRGTHLITAVERLVLYSGEFQRIALSATVRPLDVVAEFVGGYGKSSRTALYKKREVVIVDAPQSKQYKLSICYPDKTHEESYADTVWDIHAAEFRKHIASHNSTLLFANSRKTSERVARLINTQAGDMVAYSHHGSLSREIRLAVEQKLKQGDLKAIVATSSLELGIDIGELDQVILIQTPPALSSAVQRIGRAGHKVGEVSKALFYPLFGRELLLAAVSIECIKDRDIESIQPVLCPLDVLAQVILSMTSVEVWNVDELYDVLRCSYPYHTLSRKQYELVISMLAGRYADTPLNELKSRLSLDKIDNTLKAKRSVPFLLFMAGGTIPDRGYFNLRLQSGNAKIGELDEEFVWERNVGDTFALGVQAWRIQRITHNDVEVVPADKGRGMIPFWRADPRNRDSHFSMRILRFLEGANKKLDSPDFENRLIKEYYMEQPAASELIRYLVRQKQITGVDLPHRHHIVIEHYNDPFNTTDSKQVIIHTLWGGRVNRPFAFALAQAWQESYHYPLEVFVDDDCILINLPHEFSPSQVFHMVSKNNVITLLQKKLEASGFFGALFRENAGRALLLPKTSFSRRMPLWLNRLRAQKLFKAVTRYDDFPLILETWRQCLHDEFDLKALNGLLDEILNGEIDISEATTQGPSPFASNIVWRQTNKYMYEDDTPKATTGSSLAQDLFKQVISSAALRPRFSEALIADLERKLKRTAPGYAPSFKEDLLDWVIERLFIPEQEWQELAEAFAGDTGQSFGEVCVELLNKIVKINFPHGESKLITAVENLPRIFRAFNIEATSVSLSSIIPDFENAGSGIKNGAASKVSQLGKIASGQIFGESGTTLSELLEQFLNYYGPFDPERLVKIFGITKQKLEELVLEFVQGERVSYDQFRKHSQAKELCVTENVERLLRMYRLQRRPQVEARPAADVGLFLAVYQGVVCKGRAQTDLQSVLEKLFGFPAPVQAWEEYIFPARLQPYYQAWLDSVMQCSELIWLGCGKKQITFCFTEDCPLFRSLKPKPTKVLPGGKGKFSLLDIAGHLGVESGRATQEVWRQSWQGVLTNDTFEVLRKGALHNFTAAEIQGKRPARGRRGYTRWQVTRPLLGSWYAVPYEEDGKNDPLLDLEMQRQRVRQLLDRYGIIFRELLARELPDLRWAKLFRCLRIMELSGEIYAGYFFENVPGLQFAAAEALRVLRQELPYDAIFWINACDPASLCGSGLGFFKGKLPRRVPTTYLVYHGSRHVLSVLRNGKALEIHVESGSGELPGYYSLFNDMLTREFNPLKAIKVEIINGEAAVTSEYKSGLLDFGFKEDYKVLVLRKKYG